MCSHTTWLTYDPTEHCKVLNTLENALLIESYHNIKLINAIKFQYPMQNKYVQPIADSLIDYTEVPVTLKRKYADPKVACKHKCKLKPNCAHHCCKR